MEDFILREIDKIGKLIEAILVKLGVLRRAGAAVSLQNAAKTELAEKLDMDIDELVGREDFVEILVNKYGFSNDNLEKFAELLFDFVAVVPVEMAVSPDVAKSPQDAASDTLSLPDEAELRGSIPADTAGYMHAIASIYEYLMKSSSSLSLNSYYIIEELGKYKGDL